MQINSKKSIYFLKKLLNICTRLIFLKLSIPLERILPDKNSSFRVLYHNVSPEVFSWNFHYHPEIELVFVFGGIGRRHVGNHVSYYENGDLVVIGSNLPHSGFGYGALAMHEEVVIQFRREIILDGLEFEPILTLFKKADFGLSFIGKTREILMPIFKEMLLLEGFDRYIKLLQILKILADSNEYVTLNLTQYEKSNFSKDQKRVLKIFEFVERNFAAEIKTKEMADLSNLTIPAFCNYFKKNFGVSFTDFLNEYRINQACMKLSEGKSIKDVCFECGFNSLSYFSRSFKNIKNITPTDFQKNLYFKQKKQP